jgi:hypothetical protein
MVQLTPTPIFQEPIALARGAASGEIFDCPTGRDGRILSARAGRLSLAPGR